MYQYRITNLVPVVFIFIASVQIALTVFNDLSQWKGGGFGMFSTIDSPTMRTVVVRYIQENEVSAFVIHDILPQHKNDVAVTIPTGKRLIELQKEIRQYTFFESQSTSIRQTNTVRIDKNPPMSINIEVWTSTYQPDDGLFTRRLLRTYVDN